MERRNAMASNEYGEGQRGAGFGRTVYVKRAAMVPWNQPAGPGKWGELPWRRRCQLGASPARDACVSWADLSRTVCQRNIDRRVVARKPCDPNLR